MGRGKKPKGRAGRSGRRSLELRASARRLALDTLVRADEEDRFIDEVLAERIGELPRRDRRLLQEIVYGAVRHRNTLDRVLDVYLELPVARQRPVIRHALRLATYQVVYLSRVPAHAAVDQTLEALKSISGITKRDVGFVNAVLHRAVRDVRRKGPEPPREGDDPCAIPARSGYCHFSRPVLPLRRLDVVAHLAARHSHPEWLVRRWRERLGEEECVRLLEANNRIPSVELRITSRASSREAVLERLRAEGFEVEEGEREEFVRLGRGGDLAGSETLREGLVQVQDPTAAALGSLLAPPRGARVLDLCSAPGGKAVQLLEAVGESGHVVAADRDAARLELVRANLERLGTNFTLRVVGSDPDAIDLGETFSHVLVDAPCSNTGVLARRPDARWRVRPRDLDSLGDLQRRLLEAARRHVAPTGRLLYATCSIEPEENEERIADFVARHDEFTELDTRLHLPHRGGGDGGFGSLLLRRRQPPLA